MSERNHGIIKAVIVNLVIGAVGSLLVKWLATWLLNPLAGMLLAYITLAMSLLYFGALGFRQVPIGYLGIGLWFEERVPDQIYPEGWCWNWPKPFADIKFEDVREETLDIKMTEVLTNDNVPVTLDLSVQLQVINLSRALDVKNPKGAIEEAVDSNTRIIVQTIDAERIGQEKKDIPDKIRNGTIKLTGQAPSDSAEIENLGTQSLGSYSESQWGYRIINIRITSIRLPKEMEDARTNVQVMKAERAKEIEQAAAEVIEANHVAALIKIYTDAQLSPAMAANVAQSERGKAIRIIVDGNADSLEKAGVAAAALNSGIQPLPPGVVNKQPSSSEPSSTSPAFKGSRRRNK